MHIVYAPHVNGTAIYNFRGEPHEPIDTGGEMADFEWDPDKETLNVEKRNLDFATASKIWRGSVVEKVDERLDYGETRVIATGELDGSVLVVVYTWRGETRRIISARKANSREKRRYEQEIARRSRPPA